ncbi:MAG TPA: hypothetical protein VGJ77_13015 [Gaiellaceae bacterium]
MRRVVFLAAAVAALWLAPGALGAGWCLSGEAASDRVPDVPAGAQVHVLYAVPSDAADNFAAAVPGILDDVTRIDAWWRTQDPTRTPRFDLAPTPECTDLGALDLTFVRLTAPSAQLSSNTFRAVVRALPTVSGLGNDFKRYLVYFDGPVDDPSVCGVGSGGEQSGEGGYAMVLMQACPRVSKAVTAAHELLHAMGALPLGAPHPCPGDLGHPCDSSQDILFPRASSTPLEALALDVGRDDYYGHGGSWFDLQDSALLRHLDAAQVPLTVGLNGRGHVVSDLPGLDCTATCTVAWDAGTRVSLEATGDDQVSRFVGWRGACSGLADCSVPLGTAASATAVFGPVTVPVRVTVAGRGRVVCSPRCSTRFRAGDLVTLRAVPAKGWRFAGWSGACRGTRVTCRPATDFAVSARAIFRRR